MYYLWIILSKDLTTTDLRIKTRDETNYLKREIININGNKLVESKIII